MSSSGYASNIDTPEGMARAVAELENRIARLPPGGQVITVNGALYLLDRENKRGNRARREYPDFNCDRVFEAMGWTIEVADKPRSAPPESLSAGSAGLSIGFGICCAIVALLFITVVVESCKEKLGIERRGSGNVDVELIKERAQEQACLDHMRRSGDIPFECKRYAP